MNKIKLLGRLQDFFNADEKERKKKAREIADVIEKLKEKARNINEMLDECRDEEMTKALRLEVNIINAQIEKGLSVLKNAEESESR
ncbi:hypothetical protein [Methylomonas sp. MgM2]